MNNSTTARPYSNTTVTYPLDYYYAFFVNSITVVRIYQIGYPITFVLGFIGNLASLITFSRATLRKVSTGCLFIVLAISDTFFLFMCLIDFLEFGLKVSLYRRLQYPEFCRFRAFVLSVSQVLSSWILVIISLDRWIRVRFPYKSGSLCTPTKALLVVFGVLILDVALHAQLLTPLFGMIVPGYALLACGPDLYNASYFMFYFYDWAIVQILIICLIPVILLVLFLIDIFINIRIRKRALVQPTTGPHDTRKNQQQKNLQMQMFVLMVTSIAVFFITVLPVAIYKIKSPRQSISNLDILSSIADIWIGLGWLQTLNYAMNFYTHCLTSTLFRKEFKLQVRYLCGDRQARANAMELTATAFGTRTNAH